MPETTPRRSDRQKSTEEALSLLSSASFGHFATLTEDGYPYVIPVNHALMDDKIYIHSAPSGHKLRNLAARPKVCFEVSEMICVTEADVPCEYSAEYTSAVVFGKAHIVDDPTEKLMALKAISLKYTGKDGPFSEKDIARVVLVRIQIEHITAKAK